MSAIPIGDNVFAIPITNRNFLYVIKGTTTTIIDSGLHFPGSYQALQNELKAINVDKESISQLFLTHHDLDHVGNAAMLQKETGCSIYISQHDLPYVTGRQKRPGIKRVFEMINAVERPKSILAYDNAGRMGEFQIIPTPGHTPGHVCVLYRNILFAGDLVLVKNRHLAYHSDLLTWDKEKLVKSTKKISSLSFEWLCPGDAAPVKVCDILNAYSFVSGKH